MDGLLKLHVGTASVPNGGAAGFATFADQYVALHESITYVFIFLERHQSNIRKVNIKPADIWVSKIGLRSAPILLGVQHLSETHLGDLSKRHRWPAVN